MVQDSLWKLLGILICVVMLFVAPMMMAYERQDQILYNMVETEVNQFCEKAREVGYVDEVMLNDFYAHIYSTGLSYDVNFEHLEKAYSDDSGEMKAYYDGIYTEDIIDAIESSGEYRFHVGDFFFVRIESTSRTKSQSMASLFGMGNGSPGIYCTSGGVVRYGDH